MSVEEMAARYIEKTERVFEELKMIRKPECLDSSRVEEVVEEAKRYLKDAKYYLDKRQFGTSLASEAYCEGLLDALRMLGFIMFEW